MDKVKEENKLINNDLIVESEYSEINLNKKKQKDKENEKSKKNEKEKTLLQCVYDFFEELMSIVFDALYQAQYLITKNRKTIFWAFVSVFALSNFNVLSLGQIMEDNGLTKNNKSGGGDIKLPILYGGDEGANTAPASNPKPANTGSGDNNVKNSGGKDNKNSNSNDKKNKNKDKNNDDKNKDKDKDKDKSNKSSKNGGIVDLSGKLKETRKEKRASRKAAKQERQAKDKALKDKYMSGSMFERIKKYVMKGLTAISIVLVLYAVVLFPIIICAVFLYKVLKYCFTNLKKL